MNRTFALGLLLSYGVVLNAVAGPQQVVFERYPAIWISNLDGSGAQKITQGSGPDLSPDGSRIVFNTDSDVREIAIADVATKKVTLVKGIPSKNCQHAIWSPDGKQILFNIWQGNDWDLALIAPDGSGYRIFKKAGSDHQSLWSTSWAPDGKSIFGQDLDYVYQFNLEGAEMKKWKVDSIFPKGGLSSGSTIACSPDGKTLLVEVEMDEEPVTAPDWDGPPPTLWMFDLKSARSTRLTKKGVMASSGCWLDNNHILFNLLSTKEKQSPIYEMDLEKKEMKAVIKNAVNPGVARSASG